MADDIAMATVGDEARCLRLDLCEYENDDALMAAHEYEKFYHGDSYASDLRTWLEFSAKGQKHAERVEIAAARREDDR